MLVACDWSSVIDESSVTSYGNDQEKDAVNLCLWLVTGAQSYTRVTLIIAFVSVAAEKHQAVSNTSKTQGPFDR